MVVRDVESYIVAIALLSTPVETEARALAADLGTLAYSERLKLASGAPVIVLSTHELDRAEALLAKLRARGHDAVLCRASDVVPASAMISLRRFDFDDDAIIAGDARLPWIDISVLVRARHRLRIEQSETVKEKKIALGRALATGGLVMRKAASREVITHTDDSEPVLYLFRRSGEPAWILREQGTHFGALGAERTPTASRNFVLTVELVRSRAPHARFDDRLVARKASPEEVDLLAHLVAAAP